VCVCVRVRACGSRFSCFVLLSPSSDLLQTVSHFTVRIISLSLSLSVIFVCFLGFIWNWERIIICLCFRLIRVCEAPNFGVLSFPACLVKSRVSELIFLSFTSSLGEIQFF
jgi:hypothetical protein